MRGKKKNRFFAERVWELAIWTNPPELFCFGDAMKAQTV